MLCEKKCPSYILETSKHTHPHMHKHVDMNETMQIIEELWNRQLEPKNLSTRKDLIENLSQSFVFHFSDEEVKEQKSYIINDEL